MFFRQSLEKIVRASRLLRGDVNEMSRDCTVYLYTQRTHLPANPRSVSLPSTLLAGRLVFPLEVMALNYLTSLTISRYQRLLWYDIPAVAILIVSVFPGSRAQNCRLIYHVSLFISAKLNDRGKRDKYCCCN
jgi:hypothetical protein